MHSGKVRARLRSLPPLRWAYRRAARVAQSIRFFREYFAFKRLADPSRFPVRRSASWAVLGEWTADHSFDRHYVFHPAWAARILAKTRPEYHVDISSTLHFCSIISAFIPVRYYEFRSLDLGLSHLSCGSADLLALPFGDASIASLSCMHVVEHLGLGRYGDPLDPAADRRAAAELQRVLAVGGSFLFVAPTGRERLSFNAQRIYSYDQVLDLFKGLSLRAFAWVPDDPAIGGLIESASRELANRQECGCGWGRFPKSGDGLRCSVSSLTAVNFTLPGRLAWIFFARDSKFCHSYPSYL
jgi:hypothetical protein